MKDTLLIDNEEFIPSVKIKTKDDTPDNNDNTSEEDIPQPTELGEAIRELNKDDPEVDGKMSSIDRVSRISKVEKAGYHAFASLIAMDFLPKNALFILRSGLRLSVSLDGKGRKEIVEVVRGVKDAESKSGMMDKFAGVFAGNKGGPK